MIRFYDIDLNYTNYLKGISNKIPNIAYSTRNKFICGVVLSINGHKYYAPVSSCNKPQDSNFVLYDIYNKPISSIRFSFMFPALKDVLNEINIAKYLYSHDKKERDYGRLIRAEFAYCKKYKTNILKKASRIYKARCSDIPLYV